MSDPLCSFVIVSFQCKEYLLSCLESINQFGGLESEIIVVDNNSTDGTRQALESYHHIKKIFLKTNTGFSAACNRGLSEAQADVVCFLNPDTRLTDDHWKTAAGILASGRAALVSASVFDGNGNPEPGALLLPTVKGIIKEAVFLSYLLPEHIPDSSPQALSGCCLMGRKQDLMRLGGFDESMFWCEDVDLCHRAMKAGIELLLFKDWKILHYGGKSAEKHPEIALPNQIISKFRFFKKHHSPLYFWAALVPAYFHIISRIFIFFIASAFLKGAWKKCKAYILTFFRFTRYIFRGDVPLTD